MIRPRRPLLRALASEIHAIRLMQPCRDSSKSSPASRTLAGTRRSLRQPHAGLQGLVEVFASLMQACRDSSKSSPASRRLAWLRFTVNQLKHACMAPIYRKSASNMLAWPRYTVYQLQTGLQGPDIQYISVKQDCRAPIYSISAPSRLAWPDIQYSNCLKTNRYHTNKHK